MRIVFMGTPDISVKSLEILIEQGHEICAVVTQPDKPKGRGKKIGISPVKQVALDNNLDILQPMKASSKEFIDTIRDIAPDLIVVIAYGQILKKELLEIPKYGCVNVHVSLLPKYRGAAPINWVIINGEKKTGVTTMFMDEGLDTGDIIMSKEYDLDNNITAGELHDWMKDEGAKLLVETIQLIETGEYTRIKQDDSKSSYAPMMDRNLGHIDFSKSATEIHNLVRGTIPWPGAWCDSEYGKIKIWKTKVEDKEYNTTPGTIEKVSSDGIEVSCGKGTLLIEELQMPNKRRMSVSDYIKGNSIEKGSILK
ncbi:methionyl-tRNA formyltransferase [Peptostreptococcus faecalis]|uniref:methionyl-tRNA formyltransferase n=1 Tax=Peptostreptococcus faecalis TaxID=2045015 RepID=UPI000C7B4755|nr:methionyl-tRNA formyltransferase [Peptostreptococcus faecalis]